MNDQIPLLHLSHRREQLDTYPAGSRIGLELESGQFLATAILDCWERNLVAVPRDPTDTQRQDIFNHAAVHAIIDKHGICHVRDYDRIYPPSDLDDALIMYTSGSTGAPKGVVLGRKAITHNAHAFAELHDIGHAYDSRGHATCLPLHHCNALCGSLMATHLTGTPLLVCSTDMEDYFRRITHHGASTATIVPALLEKLVALKLPWPPSLRYLITAAAPLNPGLVKRFHALYGPCRLVQGYGLTEAVNFSLMMPVLENTELWEELYLCNKRPPVGAPLPGTNVRIEDGQIQVKGPNMMSGYWQKDASDRFTKDGWLITGDVGEWAAVAGSTPLIRVLGRDAETLNWRGSIWHPTEFEEKWMLERRPGAVCVPVTDMQGHEHPGICGALPTHPTIYPSPMAADSAPILTTSTGKPQRRKMGNALSTSYVDPLIYESLRRIAWDAAKVISHVKPDVTNPALGFIWTAAQDYLTCVGPRPETAKLGDDHMRTAVEALAKDWEALVSGEKHRDSVMRSRPGLWKKIMWAWPMGEYGALVADILEKRNLLTGTRILEFGHGTGNTERHINALDVASYCATDLFPKQGVHHWDFNTDPPDLPEFKKLDVIFGTNALHCAQDPYPVLLRMFGMLEPGGTIIIGEGEPSPDGREPWALHFFFGLFDGWWDVGGFKPRTFWIHMLRKAGFTDIGYSRCAAGRYDLGGAIWARKP